MLLTDGTPIDSTMTMQAFLDAVYSNRSTGLESPSAVFKAIEPHRIVIGWPGFDDVIYMTFAARATPTETITYQ